MKKFRRTFLKDEIISFSPKKSSVVERYFDKPRFSFENEFYLYIDHGTPPVPQNLTVTFIYLDKNYDEFAVKRSFSLQERQYGQTGKIEKRIKVSIQKDGKELHKILFENTPLMKSSVYVSTSEL